MTLKNLDLSILKNQDIDLLHEPIRKKKEKNHDTLFEYIYIGNIPITYRSADLRFFFKDFVESSAFKCFHYRHRPEKQVIKNPAAAENCKDDTHVSKTKDDNIHSRGHNEDSIQTVKENTSKAEDENGSSDHNTCCCIITMYNRHVAHFFEKCNGKEWRSRDLKFLKRTANIKKIKLKPKPCEEGNISTYKSNKEKEVDSHNNNQELHSEDINSSIELNPPEYILPNGNVGTTTKYFYGLIKECKMPPSLIKSLAIEFPKSRKCKPYSNVPPNYEERKKKHFCSTSATWDTIHNKSSYSKHTHVHKSTVDFVADKPCNVYDLENDRECDNNQTSFSDSKSHERKLESDENECTVPLDNYLDSDCNEEQTREDDLSEIPGRLDEVDGAEDWERHEALHNDCHNQSRLKERLFEEDIEVTWEKGGTSVYYTDAYFWDKMKGSDFDADTTDDWDVDYSIYYEDGAGDKPARDQLQMRLEQRRRRGKKDGPIKPSQLRHIEKSSMHKMNTNFAEFEKYSKGFGSRILKEHGWSEGSGVGSWREGITEPLPNDGQKPRQRTGLGYYGEKLDRTVNLKRNVERDVRISTKYDKRDGEHVDAMRFHGLDLLKYWDRSSTTENSNNNSNDKEGPS